MTTRIANFRGSSGRWWARALAVVGMLIALPASALPAPTTGARDAVLSAQVPVSAISAVTEGGAAAPAAQKDVAGTAHVAADAPSSTAASDTQGAVPALRARVTDTTGTLDAARRQALEQRLEALEQRKGAQLAVLIVPTTAPETIEQFATRVFDDWKLGRKDTDDGVLLILAKDDRALRIEVGYGLEGAIPDAIAGRIIREQIVPRLQAGDYAGGIDAGVSAIEKLVDGEALPAPAVPTQPALDSLSLTEIALPLLLGVIVLVLAASTVVAGLGVAVASWMVFGVWWAALAGGIVGLALSGLLGVLGIKRLFRKWLGRGGRGGGGGGFGGGFRGGRGGGFGGGFRGGFGGRSGGGGASGRW